MTTILIKKKDTAGAPAAGDLTNAAGGTEIAVNTATKRIYTKDSGGNVVELGTNPSVITNNLLFSPDNTYDIGASGTSRPRSLFLGTNITVGSLTSTRVPYASTGGLLVDSANLLFDGTTLTANALTTTSTVTINGGTANGVAYLNGSKVLTTGSALTFDGTSLGIATTSPVAKLDIGGIGSTQNGLRLTNFSGSPELASFTTDTSTGQIRIGGTNGSAGNYFPVFYANGSEQMRLTSTGLGIGTSSPVGRLDLGTGTGQKLSTFVNGNVRYGLGVEANEWRAYATTGAVLTFGHMSGSDGTTFTERMRLDSSGLLTVGNTSPAGSSQITAYGASNGQIAVQNSTNWSRLLQNAGDLYIDNGVGGSTGNTIFRGGSSTIELMRLDSNGNLLIGRTTQWDGEELGITGSASSMRFLYARSTSAGHYLSLGTNGTLPYIEFGNGAGLAFNDGASERARITSGGYFKASNAGTYNNSAGAYHELYSNASGDWIGYFTQATASNPNGVVIQYTAAAPNGTGNTFLYCNDNAAVRATIRSNGGLANYQSNNVDLSDARTKTDINPLGSYWSKISGLEIVTYKYKDQTHDDLNIGVIAQQVEQIAPEFVDADGFGETPEDGIPLKTVYNKDLTFAAIKALQEAMSRIEALEAQVAKLKGA